MYWPSRRPILGLLLTICVLFPNAICHQSKITKIRMPNYQPKVNDAYVCAGMSVSDLVGMERMVWVTQYRALSDAGTAHHMLLFQCDDLLEEEHKNGKYWECGHHGVCMNSRIMYAWAKNAEATHLPEDVGFKIGGDTKSKYLVLQIHYAHPLPAPDNSGVELTYTEHNQKYQAGIYLLVSGGSIPGNTPVTHLDANCALDGDVAIHPFAYRAHAHSLGVVITGYRYSIKNSTLAEMARGNPQWPQAFYPMKYQLTVEPGDLLHARCTYNSTGRNRTTKIGMTGEDEMCNLYVMYYSDAVLGRSSYVCGIESRTDLTANLPADSDTPLPPNPLLEEKAKTPHPQNTNASSSSSDGQEQPPKTDGQDADSEPDQLDGTGPGRTINPAEFNTDQRTAKTMSGLQFVSDWGGSAHSFGQVVAVSLETDGTVVLFHRGSRKWEGATFMSNNRLRDTTRSIPENTIVFMHPDSGEIQFQMGSNFFSMPHGLTIDHENNVWCTDVGMHQVFKFGARGGSGVPLMALGTRFEPGDDDQHFCKPTAVAVQRDGSFFVADGYCNSRLLKFPAGGGRPLLSVGKASSTFALFGSLLGRRPAVDQFNIPHALALSERRGLVCVADRENGRVVCFNSSTLAPDSVAADHTVNWISSRIFSVAQSYDGSKDRLYAVSGPNHAGNRVQGYVVDMEGGEVESTFSPAGNGLSNPHDVAAAADGSAVYVVELSPPKIWKFTAGPHSAQRKNAADGSPSLGAVTQQKQPATDSSSFFSRLTVAALFALPLIVFIAVMIVLRMRRRGHRGRYLVNLSGVGRLGGDLGAKEFRKPTSKDRRGFEPLNTEDVEFLDDSDTDVEEFMATIKSRV